MSNRIPIGHITALIVWIVIFSAVYMYFDVHQEPKVVVAIKNLPSSQIDIPRSKDGHYYVRGSINGHPVDFMVDTGASIVSVSKEFANSANLPSGIPASFSTAGGIVQGEITSDQIVEAGGLAINGLSVSVGIHGKMALLGQNFLRRVDVIQSNDTLTLRIREE